MNCLPPRAGQDHAADGAGEHRHPHDDHRAERCCGGARYQKLQVKIEEVLDSYDRVTADDILNLARRVFDRSKLLWPLSDSRTARIHTANCCVESALHLLAEVGDHIPTGDNTAEDTASVHYRYKNSAL